jgi:hypothetical protein
VKFVDIVWSLNLQCFNTKHSPFKTTNESLTYKSRVEPKDESETS